MEERPHEAPDQQFSKIRRSVKKISLNQKDFATKGLSPRDENIEIINETTV